MCAPITWQGARKLTMAIVRMGAALGAGSGTFRLPPEYLFVGTIFDVEPYREPNRDPNPPNPNCNPSR